MVNEVGKIIRNTLLSHGAVFLPSVGTLYVSRKGATLLSKSRVEAPEYTIEYASNRESISVVDAIAKCASVNTESAEDIYMLWLDKVRKEDVVEIYSVGTLRNKSFIVADELIKMINPAKGEITTITKLRRRGGRVALYIVIVVAIIVAAVGVFLHSPALVDKSTKATPSADIEPSQPIENSPIVNPQDIAISADELLPETEMSEDIIKAEEIVEEDTRVWFERENICHYVVVGSYSRKRNAEYAIGDINSRNLPYVACYCFMRDKMHTIAIYGSSDVTACEEFVALHKEEFPQAWVYSAEEL